MGTHYKGSPQTERALDTFIKLMRCSASVAARGRELLEVCDLTLPQFATLEALFHLGPLTMQEISQKTLTSAGNITLVVDNLEKNRLVERRRDRENRRFISVHITPEGEQLMARIFPTHAANLEKLFNVLSSDEQQVLGELCKKLGLEVKKHLGED